MSKGTHLSSLIGHYEQLCSAKEDWIFHYTGPC